MTRRAGALLGLTFALTTTPAHAQPRPARPLPPPTWQPATPAAAPSPAAAPADPRTTALRARFGTDVAARLLRSPDAGERLRGLERAAAMHSPEALAMLERAAGAGAPGGFDPRAPLDGAARSDPRALLVVVRGLAGWLDREPARAALTSILGAPTQQYATRVASTTSRDPAGDDIQGAARIVLARQEAAMALASTGSTLTLEALIAAARAGGPGQGPSLDALAVYPPSAPLLGGVTLTTPAMIALAIDVGDLRSLDAVRGATRASDPALRATAIAALGVAGDLRAIDLAREALKDHDARVRVAGADALVHLGAPDAAPAVEALIGDDATARAALHLAQDAQGEGITKAAAARAVVSADLGLREAAVAALGRQTSPAAVGALAILVRDARLQGDAAQALARSPSTAAMPTLEALGAAPGLRRTAGRAYFVRRATRGERSPRLDALLAALAASTDPADRVVGVEALVALGERPLDRALADRDAHVRRAAAMGSHALGDGAARTLVAALAVETDEPTRQVLALGLAGGEAASAVPTLTLLERAQAGGPDAPLAALALARRDDDELAARIDALLASPDPVLRAHVARGLGASHAPDALGRLARAYTWEADVEVRRALVAALRQAGHGEAPASREALDLAARLDPDGVTRALASGDRVDSPARHRSHGGEIAWVRLVPADGAALPHDMTAALVDPEGLAVPIAFDDEGYALLPGVPPGDARLRLAPRLPAYEAPSP